jgi:CRP-like cAMP-binding protein
VASVHDILLRKLRVHSEITAEDDVALRALGYRIRELEADEDLVRQGDVPQVAVMVVEGELARYHTLYGGKRQYLSLHLAGDWPDVQAIFLRRLDHSLCALNHGAVVAVFQHDHLRALIARSPTIVQTLWRETLIDAAIFRAAITNNSARNAKARMAHFFCEIFYRARRAELVHDQMTALPMHQGQLGETLGMALVTVNRTLRDLRRTGAVDFRDGRLRITHWELLAEIGEFDPEYLHDRPIDPSRRVGPQASL